MFLMKGGKNVTTSAKIQEKILEFLEDCRDHSVQEIKKYLEEVNLDDYTEGQFAGSINTLVRNGSIRKKDRGVYALKIGSEKRKTCFVVSPIGSEGSPTRNNADKLFKYIIKPACDECDFQAIRVDKLNDANSITQTIIEQLEEADLVIADISFHNPNVFYEMGFRARTKKPIIHLKTKNEQIPFDVNTIRTFDYDLTDLDNVSEIKSRLVKTIKSFNYKEDEEELELDEDIDTKPSIIPLLYQILDAIADLKKEVKNINTETIGTVIKSMQNSNVNNSSLSSIERDALIELLSNPDSIVNLIKLSKELSFAKK